MWILSNEARSTSTLYSNCFLVSDRVTETVDLQSNGFGYPYNLYFRTRLRFECLFENLVKKSDKNWTLINYSAIYSENRLLLGKFFEDK